MFIFQWYLIENNILLRAYISYTSYNLVFIFYKETNSVSHAAYSQQEVKAKKTIPPFILFCFLRSYTNDIRFDPYYSQTLLDQTTVPPDKGNSIPLAV